MTHIESTAEGGTEGSVREVSEFGGGEQMKRDSAHGMGCLVS